MAVEPKVEDSILATTKKLLNIPDEMTNFDLDIITHINGVLLILQQLGVGPTTGHMITGRGDTWVAYLGPDKNLNIVKPYLAAKVRLLFDPPQTGPLTTALEKVIQEYEWRLREQFNKPATDHPLEAYIE